MLMFPKNLLFVFFFPFSFVDYVFRFCQVCGLVAILWSVFFSNLCFVCVRYSPDVVEDEFQAYVCCGDQVGY